MRPRTVDTEEKGELLAYCLEHYHSEASASGREEQELFLANAAIAAFDRYSTDGPGYAGKLMMVVWSGSPSFYTVFIWTDGVLHEVEREG